MILLAPSVRIITSGALRVNNNFCVWKTFVYQTTYIVSKPMTVSFRFTQQLANTKA